MQHRTLLLILSICFLLASCSETKTLSNGAKVDANLAGSWELTYITGPRITFDGLYPDKKPQLIFDLNAGRVSGNTSCNSLTGAIKAKGNSISFKEGFAATKMFCPGSGESVFLKALEEVETYKITENTLAFSSASGELMRFTRK